MSPSLRWALALFLGAVLWVSGSSASAQEPPWGRWEAALGRSLQALTRAAEAKDPLVRDAFLRSAWRGFRTLYETTAAWFRKHPGWSYEERRIREHLAYVLRWTHHLWLRHRPRVLARIGKRLAVLEQAEPKGPAEVEALRRELRRLLPYTAGTALELRIRKRLERLGRAGRGGRPQQGGPPQKGGPRAALEPRGAGSRSWEGAEDRRALAGPRR